MAIKNGWTTDSKNTASKHDKYINGGDLSPAHAAFVAKEQKKCDLSKGQMKRNKIGAERDFKGTW